MSKKDVAAYIRVSTEKQEKDGKGLENQINAITNYCQEKGITIKDEHWYKDVKTGRNIVLENRDRMLADLKKGKIGTVIVFSLDRLSRNSTVKSLSIVEGIYSDGGTLISLAQPFLNDLSESIRPVVISIFAMIAHEESKNIGRRVKAAHERAKKEGQKMGRPPKSEVRLAQAVAAYTNGGFSVRAAAEKFNVPASSIHTRVRVMRQKGLCGPAPSASVRHEPHADAA